MRRSRQMSESIELGIVLALAGGFMDAIPDNSLCFGLLFTSVFVVFQIILYRTHTHCCSFLRITFIASS